jgi:hypothetical protein
MVAPELPTRIPIGYTIFHHHPHSQCNHAMGILAAGRRHIAQVRAKILVTPLAMVLRIGDVQFHWTPRYQIANLMQLAMVDVLSSGGFPARWARAVTLIAGFFDDLRSGQVFDPHKRSVGSILAWAMFGSNRS